jgi:hypothetical protein
MILADELARRVRGAKKGRHSLSRLLCLLDSWAAAYRAIARLVARGMLERLLGDDLRPLHHPLLSRQTLGSTPFPRTTSRLDHRLLQLLTNSNMLYSNVS